MKRKVKNLRPQTAYVYMPTKKEREESMSARQARKELHEKIMRLRTVDGISGFEKVALYCGFSVSNLRAKMTINGYSERDEYRILSAISYFTTHTMEDFLAGKDLPDNSNEQKE